MGDCCEGGRRIGCGERMCEMGAGEPSGDREQGRQVKGTAEEDGRGLGLMMERNWQAGLGFALREGVAFE